MTYQPQCDRCAKLMVAENDIFESVLCSTCNNQIEHPPKLHCVVCGTVVFWQNVVARVKKILPYLKIPGWIALGLGIIGLVLKFVSKALALKFALGVVGIPLCLLGLALGLGLLFGAALLITVGAHNSARWLMRKIGLYWPNFVDEYWGRGQDREHAGDGAQFSLGLVHWLFGVIILGSPVWALLIGSVLYRWIFD